MKTPAAPPPPAAEEQAALWAARLDGGAKLSADDQLALEAWLAEHPAHRALLSQYCQFSTDLEEQLPALVATGAVRMPEERKPRRSPALGWFAGLGLAAAAALAVVLWPGAGGDLRVTPMARRDAFTLSDGTRIELNARTSVKIELTATERRVQLAGGEAFFAVAKDPARAFIVQTPAGAVRVTGTQFNVRNENAGDLEVTVAEGSVQVRPAAAPRDAAPFELEAGDKLTAGAAGISVQALTVGQLQDALAWRQGKVVFEGTPLEEAAARFARFHGIGIRVEGKAAAHALGGAYSLDDYAGFLNSLPVSFPVTVKREPSGTWVIAPRG